MVDPFVVIVVCCLLVFLGAVIQGVIGIGLSLVSAPVIAILDHTLVPGTLIVSAVAMPIVTLLREHDDIDWKGMRWAFPWRLVGTAVGTWLVVVASSEVLGLAVGVFVLGAVGLSLITWKPRPTPIALSIAGVVSGIGSTTTSIGGPPLALVYQHARPTMLRSTMAVYFVAGNAISLISLSLAGALTWRQISIGLVTIPFVIGGFALALFLRPRVNATKMRGLVLAASVAGALTLIATTLL